MSNNEKEITSKYFVFSFVFNSIRKIKFLSQFCKILWASAKSFSF